MFLDKKLGCDSLNQENKDYLSPFITVEILPNFQNYYEHTNQMFTNCTL